MLTPVRRRAWRCRVAPWPGSGGRFRCLRGLARVLGAVIVPVCLGAVAAGGHGAPAAGPVAGGVEEPQDAGRMLAAADPLWRLFQQLEEIGSRHDPGPPCWVVDLQRLP